MQAFCAGSRFGRLKPVKTQAFRRIREVAVTGIQETITGKKKQQQSLSQCKQMPSKQMPNKESQGQLFKLRGNGGHSAWRGTKFRWDGRRRSPKPLEAPPQCAFEAGEDKIMEMNPVFRTWQGVRLRSSY
jgi:hypothetical protein